MRLDRVRWWRYRIPFRTPFATAHGVLAQREGVLLELTSDAGGRGLGEVAPLPRFGGSVEELWQQVPTIAGFLLEQVAAEEWCHLGNDAPGRWSAALRCGVETALLDITARSSGRSLASLLGPQPATAVPVNATVGAGTAAMVAERAARAVAAGFSTVKLKVGTEASVAAEAARVAAVRAAIGDARHLRLDANEAWRPDAAIAVIRACETHRPEWVEQPVTAADVAGLARVRRAVGAPIAADEAVTGEEAVRSLLAAEAVDVLILKPMLVGGLVTTLRLANLAHAAGVSAIVTSTLEAGVGLAAAAQVASVLPAPLRACGLATATLLEDDLLTRPLRIEQGCLHRPREPGLGIQVDWVRVRRYTIATGDLTAQ